MSEAQDGPSETPSIQALKNKLKRRRYELRNGIGPKSKLTPKLRPVTGRSEFDENGNELVLKVGLQWLHHLGMALIACGMAWDSRVTTAGCRPGYSRLELQSVRRDDTLGLRGPGYMWSPYEIPNGAINNQDVKWVLKQILSPEQTRLVMAKSRDLAPR